MRVKLLFGDCLERMKEISDNFIDTCITDPPYGINYKSGRQGVDRIASIKYRKDTIVREPYFSEIQNDESFPIGWTSEVYRILKNGSSIYVFCHWKTYLDAKLEVESAGFKIKNLIILNKSNHGMGDLRGSYAPKHELLIFAAKGRHLLNFPDGREKDVWDVPVKYSGAKRLHPNEKPVSWILPAILNSSNPNDIVLDPFMGSGTTGIACVNTERDFIGIEKDEHYFKIAKARIQAART